MLQTTIAGFTMGAIGSFHCIGMCGPLALALPLQQHSLLAKFKGTLLYNTGRVTAYAIFGILSGTLGTMVAMSGFQQGLSIGLGLTVIALLLLPKLFPKKMANLHFAEHFFIRLRAVFGQLFFKKNQSTLFAIGFLNGLLPCGMVYLALAGAAATGNIAGGALFMIAFGMGTLPAMWSIAFWGNFITVQARQKIRAAYPYLMILMACLLILRGMGLGIPYVSPATHTGKQTVHCVAQPSLKN
ncbi:MAG: hypothetical protein RL172_2374 [Bacteroidota bacterium]|jgi:uncharacterized protein